MQQINKKKKEKKKRIEKKKGKKRKGNRREDERKGFSKLLNRNIHQCTIGHPTQTSQTAEGI